MTCAGPPAYVVVYPRRDQRVPRNAVIYLQGRPRGQLLLSERDNRKRIETRLRRSKGSKLVRIEPLKPLAPSTDYELVDPTRKQRPVVRRFRTSDRLQPPAPPKISGPRLEIGSPTPKEQIGMFRAAGRGIALALSPRPTAAVLELRVGYRERGKKRWRVTQLVKLVEKTIPISKTRMRCSYYLYALAPVRGDYRIRVVPWSAAGHEGRAVQLSGRLERGKEP